MDVVRKIQQAPSSANRKTNTEAQRLTPPITVTKVARRPVMPDGRRSCRGRGPRRPRMLAFVIQLRRAELARHRRRRPAPARAGVDHRGDRRRAGGRPRRRASTSSATAVGDAVTADDRPMIANVADRRPRSRRPGRHRRRRRRHQPHHLGAADPAGRFAERTLAEVPGPAHVHAVDLDRDGDLDVVVASLGVLFPNNARIGAVVLLENDGRERFAPHVVRRPGARASPTCAPATSTATAISICRWPSSATTRARRGGFENQGGWRFASHLLQELSGPINAEIADVDGDGDLDIVTLVSQEWEEIYAFVNDGRGGFTPARIFGASNEDFGSSWISLADLDADGDLDVVYSNGDAFDYAATAGRSWNGAAVAREHGRLAFTYHRIADIAGASSPQAADLDGDGDLDIAVVSAYNNWARPGGAEPGLARERRARPLHAARCRQLADPSGHAGGGDLTGDGRPDLVTGGMHMSWPYDRMSRVTMWTNRVARRRMP